MSRWIVCALGSAFFAGLTAIFAKMGVEGVSANLATFIRISILLPLVGLLVWITGGFSGLAISSRSWLFLILSALATGISWLLYFYALKVGPVTVVASLDKLSLAVAIILAFFFLRERPSHGQWVGAVFMVIGAILMAIR
jgi:transporter family protein